MSVKFLEKGGCLGVLVASDREPGLGLFRCAKIRKAKYACGGVWRSDVCVLNVPSGHIRTWAAVRGGTTLCVNRHTKFF